MHNSIAPFIDLFQYYICHTNNSIFYIYSSVLPLSEPVLIAEVPLLKKKSPANIEKVRNGYIGDRLQLSYAKIVLKY